MKALNDAALSRAQAFWNANQVHKAGSVPASPVTPYLVISVGSGSGESYTLEETGPGTRSHRLVAQAIGRTLDELGFAVDKADGAFVGVRLTEATTTCRPEVSSPVFRDPDAGALLVCTLTYTFTEEQ